MAVGQVLMGLGVILSALTAPLPGDGPPLPAPPVAVAPAPRLAGPPVAVEAVPGGYQILLNRRTAELLQDALANADEKQLAGLLRDLAKQQKEGANADPDRAAMLELVAFLVSSQLPGFKKALDANMGPGGVTIRLTGLQAPTVKFKTPRPRLEKALEVVRGVMPLLPDEARDAIEALRAVGRTTPLIWKVEPR